MKHVFWLLMLAISFTAYGQSVFRLDSIPQQGILLNKGWTWHAGDNPAWAKPELDDSKWEGIDPTKDIYYLPQVRQAELGWFRIRLRVSPSVLNRSLAMVVSQFGASEIYLNGRLIYRFGVVSADYDHEQTYLLYYQPFQLQLDQQSEQVIAVRYSFNRQNFLYNLVRINSCFSLNVSSGNEAFSDYVVSGRIYTGENWTLSGLYLILAMLSIILYTYLRSDKAYLYLGLFSVCYLAYYTSLELSFHFTTTSARLYIRLAGFSMVVMGVVPVLKANMLLFKLRWSWFSRLVVVYALLAVPFLFWSYRWGGTLAMLTFLLSNTYSLIAALHGVKIRRPGAWVLIIQSVLVYLFFGGAFLVGALNKLAYFQTLNALNNFIIPVGIIIFIAGEFIRTAQSLTQRVVEVEMLSTEKEQILTTQNQTLELQVSERTAELRHKNEELVIEAALEQVRSRSLAMHSSEELKEVITLVFAQLNLLGIAITDGAAVIVLFSEGSKDVIHWTANPDRISEATRFRLPYINHPFHNVYWDARAKGLDFVANFSTLEEKNSFWDQAFVISDYKYLSEETKQWIYAAPGYAYSLAIGKHSAMFMDSHKGKMYSEQENDILKRFARVFEQAYTRFLDLQKAETQAREAQIEAALERVRSQSMAMQHSDQLQDVITVVSDQLQGLGFQFHYVNFVVVRADRGWDCYNAVPNGDILSFLIPYVDHRLFSHSEEVIQQGVDFFTYTLNPDENYEWNNYLFSQTILKDAPEEYKQFIMSLPCLVASVVIWPDIALSIARYSGVPFTDAENAIFKRFGAVFGQAYTRFKDLKKAEEQARQAIRTASLDRVRAQIASMRTAQDLERITPLIWAELTTLQVPFFRCGVFIVDEAQHRIQAFLSTPDGQSRTQLNLPIDQTQNNRQLVESWQQQQIYSERWSHDQLQQWASSMVDEGQIDSLQEYEVVEEVKEAFSLQFIPFRQGMLYVGSQEPLSQPELDVTQSLADAFSVAYARYEDFRQLEEAKVRVDATLTELKVTQTQLIQKEKLASLGELTAGIAHEIQNPLNFVNNFSEVSTELITELEEEHQKPDRDAGLEAELLGDLKQNLQKITHHGHRASSIVKGMLEHSRTGTGERQPTDLNALADEYLRLAYQGLRAKDKDGSTGRFNAELKMAFAPDLAHPEVMPQEIGRVLLNLYNNAFYAVKERDSVATPDQTYVPTVWVSTHQLANRVEIRVRDNGTGIPESVKTKIFQPFFTTKPTGEGTGLGLSLSYDIVTKGHGGTLTVQTQAGDFTEFVITLPLS